VIFLTNSAPQPHDWADLQPAVVGAVIVGALHDAKRLPRGIYPAAHSFARFYTLPAMTEALARPGR
jgi:hypothetical protein